MTNAPPLSQRLRIELDDLRERYGVEPSIEEVLWLAKACDRCDNPYELERLDLIDPPCQIGTTGVYLWRLTVSASCWLDGYAFKWWCGSDDLVLWSLTYAMANGRDPKAFECATSQDAAFDKIKELGLRLAVQKEEVEECVDFMLGKPSEKVPDSKARAAKLAQTDWSRFVQFLETQTGIAADVWLWGKSAHYALQAYTHHHETIIALAGGKANGTKTLEPLSMALTELAKVKNAIYEARKEESQ